MDEPITAEAEAFVRSLVDEWLTPHDRECLACYLDRAVSLFGCSNGLRFATRYRDLVAPRATALEQRLPTMGGYCDCEYLMNAVQPAMRLWVPEQVPAPTPMRGFDDDGDDEDDSLDDLDDERDEEWGPPDTMPPCSGVRRGSTQPCRNWSTLRRPRWRTGYGW